MGKWLGTTIILAGMLSTALAVGGGPTPQDKAITPQATAGDWPWWGGPNRNNTAAGPEPVRTWSATENVVWKVKVPGRGYSSPVVVGDRVFLTTADETAVKQSVLAFDRTTGKPLWSTVTHEGGFGPINPKNSHASATPCCDGKRLYSPFLHEGALWVTATDPGGKIVWQTRAGDFQSQHGDGPSPVLYKSLVIVNGDSLKGSFVAALDTQRGEVVWKTPRTSTGRNGGYATPVVAMLAGRPQLILTGMNEVTAYDPDTGKLLWSCAGPAEVTACAPAWSDRLVFATGGFPEKELLAIRADGTGDVTRTHVVWRSGKGVSYVPSPLYADGRLYVVTDAGVAHCFDAATGKPVWQGRLEDTFIASPVLAGGLLYAAGESGRTHVLRAGPKFEVVATNDLGEETLASPVVCGGRLFLRTDRHLWCIGR
jgi:outer membrane protein assembly factor BamB